MEISSTIDKACALMITLLTNVYVHIHFYISLKDQNRSDHGIHFKMHFRTPKRICLHT
jgi:hypothetical protein